MSLVKTGLISSMDQRVDQKKFSENYDRIFGVKPLPNEKAYLERTANYKKDRASTLDDKDSSISRMMSDKVMVNMIRSGKAEDRGLKREAEAIERENSTRPRKLFLERKQAELGKAIAELRRSQRQ